MTCFPKRPPRFAEGQKELIKRNSSKGTLILSKGTLRNTHHGIATLILSKVKWNSHHLHAMDYITCLPLKDFFSNINAFSLTQGPPPMLKLDFGLWTLSPRFSAVWPEPTIYFSTWSAVFPPKPRDFRFP